jgi:hypothetical protein
LSHTWMQKTFSLKGVRSHADGQHFPHVVLSAHCTAAAAAQPFEIGRFACVSMDVRASTSTCTKLGTIVSRRSRSTRHKLREVRVSAQPALLLQCGKRIPLGVRTGLDQHAAYDPTPLGTFLRPVQALLRTCGRFDSMFASRMRPAAARPSSASESVASEDVSLNRLSVLETSPSA